MGFRFRRSFRLMPGIRLNLSRSGVSTSIGRRGAWFTIGPRGARATVGIPGTGLSYTEQSAWRRPPAVDPAAIPIPSSVSPMDDVADERVAGDAPRPADMDASSDDEPGDRSLTVIMFAIVALIAAVSILWAVLA